MHTHTHTYIHIPCEYSVVGRLIYVCSLTVPSDLKPFLPAKKVLRYEPKLTAHWLERVKRETTRCVVLIHEADCRWDIHVGD